MDCIDAVTQSCGPGVSGAIFSQLISTLILSQCSLNPNYPVDKSSDIAPAYDFIIVGAGSAGSALAAGLSDNPNWNILVIEAGANPPQNSEIPAQFFTLMNTDVDWKYRVEPQQNACQGTIEKRCLYPRGKMLGGCSSINGMIYIIGTKNDYDNWEKKGNKGWGWKSVEKYFQKYMNRDRTQQYHLNEIPKPNIYYDVQSMLINAGKELGVEEINNPNEMYLTKKGYYTSYSTITQGTRANSAKIHLLSIKDRPNLHVVKNAHVGRVVFAKDESTVEGVEVWMNNKWTTIKANKEVILSAGAINTPQILMLSGIGPKEHLESLDIQVIKDLPVGQNLKDHNLLMSLYFSMNTTERDTITKQEKLDALYYYLTQRRGPLGTTGGLNLMGFINTEDPSSNDPNIQFLHLYYRRDDTDVLVPFMKMINFTPDIIEQLQKRNQETPILSQIPTLLLPKSKGYVLLQSKDPFEPVIIDPKYNTHPDDLKAVLAGIRHALKMSQTKAMKERGIELIRINIAECDALEYDSDDYWYCIMRYMTSTVYHPVGTAMMGQGKDSVVDERLRVHGVKNLRVADASIMPEIVAANTNAACMMIGDKAADIIKEDLTDLHTEL